MSLITPFPEAESPALDRFALHGRDGIAALLDELRHRGSLVTLYYDNAAGFTVGNVLDVDAERETVVSRLRRRRRRAAFNRAGGGHRRRRLPRQHQDPVHAGRCRAGGAPGPGGVPASPAPARAAHTAPQRASSEPVRRPPCHLSRAGPGECGSVRAGARPRHQPRRPGGARDSAAVRSCSRPGRRSLPSGPSGTRADRRFAAGCGTWRPGRAKSAAVDAVASSSNWATAPAVRCSAISNGWKRPGGQAAMCYAV